MQIQATPPYSTTHMGTEEEMAFINAMSNWMGEFIDCTEQCTLLSKSEIDAWLETTTDGVHLKGVCHHVLGGICKTE